MIKKMYSVYYGSGSYFSANIREIEVVRETEHNIWTEEQGQEKKNSSDTKHFNSWDDAHAFLLKNAETITDGLAASLKSASEELAKVKKMVSP